MSSSSAGSRHPSLPPRRASCAAEGGTPEQPVRLHGSRRPLVEVIAAALPLKRSGANGATVCGERACRAPSGNGVASAASGHPASASGLARPHRGWTSAKATSSCYRARLSDRVRVRRQHVLARGLRAACVHIRCERERAWVLEHPHAVGQRADEPGVFATTRISSTCGTSAGSDRSSSAAWPCETTTADTFTLRVSPGRQRAFARRRLAR